MIIFWNSLALCYLLVSAWSGFADASPRATPEQEARDEKNDVEILKAVYASMEEYWLRRLTGGHRKKRAGSIACFGELGCFEDTGPFGYIDMLPSSPEEVATKFQLYCGNDGGNVPLLEVPYANISQLWTTRAPKSFDVTLPTKIIVHGFGSSCNHVWVYEMRSALMSVENCNVICVDWEGGAQLPNYVRAVANTRLVGKQVAMLVRGLTDRGLALDKVHLIGFSLGAHVAGFAGAELKNVSRITGLDPAGPLFESQDPKARLDETDANFVDVIHSNGENIILGGLGSWQPMGHVDFYPNGGRMQKGCTNLFVGAVSDIIWFASDFEGRSLCNHRRAYKLFTDSVSPRCHFPAFPCESYEKFIDGKCFPCPAKRDCGNMGYYADKYSARGSLYLITREEEPFCAHQYHVKIESSPSKLPVVSYGKIEVTLMGENVNETFTLTKKDDEELGVGTVLSKIVVPHPAMREPAAVEIVYVPYNGWISSGLKKWSIDKIKLSDSYGKSLSHCKKDLLLESNEPVTLKLYPGDCNLPRESESAAAEEIDPFFLPEPIGKPDSLAATTSGTTTTTSTTSTAATATTTATTTTTTTTTSAAKSATTVVTTTAAATTTVSPMLESTMSASLGVSPNPFDSNKTVDGFPAYDFNKDYYYNAFSNDSENAESNKVILDAVLLPNSSSGSAEKNHAAKIIRRNEITEPVLQPKSAGRNLKTEIDEPVLKIKGETDAAEKTNGRAGNPPRGVRVIDRDSTAGRSPPREMYPPPPGRQESWDAARKPKTVASGGRDRGYPPFPESPAARKESSARPVTLQTKMMRRDEAKKRQTSSSSRRFRPASGNSFLNYPRNEDGSVTVQLFPQHLAAILKQAERHAKTSFFDPLEFFAKSARREDDRKGPSDDSQPSGKKKGAKRNLENLAAPRNANDGSKDFLPRIYEYVEKGLENVKSLFGFFRWETRKVGEEEEEKEEGRIRSESSANFTSPNGTEEAEPSENLDKFIPLTVECS